MRLLGGLRALVNVLKECMNEKQPCDQDLPFIEHVVSTIGSATAGHGRLEIAEQITFLSRPGLIFLFSPLESPLFRS